MSIHSLATHVPAAVTLGNLVCGLLATAAAAGCFAPVAGAAAGAPPAGGGPELAAWLVVAALCFDGVDGAVARRLGVDGDFGVRLDSLADMVSFGVAPAVLIAAAAPLPAGAPWVVAAVYSSCVAVRLARYTGGAAARGFVGLPCPAAALAACGVSLVFPGSALPAACGLVLGGLMVSRTPFPHPASLDRKSLRVWALAVVAAAVVVAWSRGPGEAMLWLAIAYLAWAAIGVGVRAVGAAKGS
ncbi:MAG: CDP-alcohol phosphatidyltransferase family protein [Planctomycetota bacterium]